MTSAFRIATQMIFLLKARLSRRGTPDEIKANPNPILQQFINGYADGPIPLSFRRMTI